ncbi:heterokaryon incompatibility protein-domain-containing protein [Cerioporus squamosus]|nr:heterokaryon incompatibility protein-domain-containing protein [Cerioporus squamosus]
MWLLSTDRAELHFFTSPEVVQNQYAALSHVWGMEEESFQDVRGIQETCAEDGTNPRDFVCEKIRRCCELAERHGYKWVWIDTCCIDKTSSAELSEACNSMFRYYALAGICYVYLRYVPFFTDVRDPVASSFFRRSIWFQRSWTLQELIAPPVLQFLSQSWQVLGSKADFAWFLERWINVPATVLRLEVSPTEYSIAQRMSWIGQRRTTRPEDETYSILGLFDIHMPILYGEGRDAFRRLQEEIVKRSADTTLFAWDDDHLDDRQRSSLFAPSPSAFALWNTTLTAPQCIVGEVNPNHDNLQSLDFLVELQHYPPGYHSLLRTYPITEINLASQDVAGKFVREGFRLLWTLPELRSCRMYVPNSSPSNSDIDSVEALVTKREMRGVCIHLRFLSLRFYQLSGSNRFPPKGAFGRSVRHLELHLEPTGFETDADLANLMDCISCQDDLRALHVTRLGSESDLTTLKFLLLSFLSAISSRSRSGFTRLSVELDLGLFPSMSSFDYLLTEEMQEALDNFPKPPRLDLRIVADRNLLDPSENLSAKLHDWMPHLENSVRVVRKYSGWL